MNLVSRQRGAGGRDVVELYRLEDPLRFLLIVVDEDTGVTAGAEVSFSTLFALVAIAADVEESGAHLSVVECSGTQRPYQPGRPERS